MFGSGSDKIGATLTIDFPHYGPQPARDVQANENLSTPKGRHAPIKAVLSLESESGAGVRHKLEVRCDFLRSNGVGLLPMKQASLSPDEFPVGNDYRNSAKISNDYLIANFVIAGEVITNLDS